MTKKSDRTDRDTKIMINQTEERKRYYETIDRCVRNKENLPISNSNERHATYLISQFFKHAQSEICILTGALYGGVYDPKELRQEAVNFLKKDSKHRLRIAYQYDVPQEEILSRKLINDIKDIKDNQKLKGSFEVWDSSDSSKRFNHFAVMDRSGFRFEIDRKKRSGVANFGDPESGETLAEIFDRIVDVSRQVVSWSPAS